MPGDAATLYQEICRYARRTSVLTSIDAVLGWDERTQLPPGRGRAPGRAIDAFGRADPPAVDRSEVRRATRRAIGDLAEGPEHRPRRRRGRPPAQAAARQAGEVAADVGRRAGPHGDPGPAGVAGGPRKGRFSFVQAPAGADHRAEAPAGRVPGLCRLPLRRLARRVRAGRADGQRGPRCWRGCARNWCRWWPACSAPAAGPTPRSCERHVSR